MKTRMVAQLLNVRHYRLHYLLATGQVPVPPRDCSGDFLWGHEHIEAARRVLEARSVKRKKAEVPA